MNRIRRIGRAADNTIEQEPQSDDLQEPVGATFMTPSEQPAEASSMPPTAEEGDAQAPSGEGAAQDTIPNLDQTSPLPVTTAEQEELTPLPANAVVTGKYVVQSQLHHS